MPGGGPGPVGETIGDAAAEPAFSRGWRWGRVGEAAVGSLRYSLIMTCLALSFRRAAPVALSLALMSACGSSGSRAVNDETGSNETQSDVEGSAETSADTSADEGSADEGSTTTGGGYVGDGVDILVVIDNSRTMGFRQGPITEGIKAMVQALEAQGINHRLAFTTTDVGNPFCQPSTAVRGQFQFESCTERPGEFASADGTINLYGDLCESACELSDDGFGKSGEEPWLESIEKTTNVGVPLADAIDCLAPQGVNGCGFESPLEAMYMALTRAEDPTMPEFGFLRSNANLLVILATDEADCSANPDFNTIFDGDGNRVFWSDPAFGYATSAVCWNAGTRCVDAAGGSLDCVPEDHDVDGNPGAAPDDAVMYPVPRYVDKIEAIRAQKRELDPSLRVGVLLLAGYDENGGLSYAPSLDEDFARNFGIAPACRAEIPGIVPCVDDGDCFFSVGTCGANGFCEEFVSGIPPVRLHEFVGVGDVQVTASICETDFAGDFVEAALGISME